ncbi:MAG: type II secretion system F family protein [Deltaproteobacteria bacterium]|nr:type II secretion system F family protein [Deltaproteobacteria bacterium]
MINFTVHLVTAISAGIPILQAFEDLEVQTTNRVLKKAVQAIMEDLRGGANLSVALSRYPYIFDQIYTSVIKAGETSGSLDRVLEHLLQYLEWQDALASEIKRATIYPTIVFLSVLLVIGLLLGFVFPRILPVLLKLDVELPLITRIVIAAGNFVHNSWYIILLAAVSFFVLVRLLKARESGRFIVDAVKLRLPVVGTLLEMICLSRFAHHLGTLMGAGIDITQTLSITERVVGNAVIAQAVRETKEKVIQGVSLWRSLQDTGVFPPMVTRMVFVGESTGTMDTSLARVTAYFDREIPAKVKRVFAILEPTIIILLAVIVLTIALSVFIPLYGALGKIGRR